MRLILTRTSPMRPRVLRPLAVLAAVLVVAACDDSPTQPAGDSLACNTTVGNIAVGDTVTGILTRESCRFADGTRADIWRLTLANPAIITIDLVSTEFDPFLIVRNSEGFLIAQDDDGGGSPNARITHGFAAGVYYIVANTYYQDEYGDYELFIE